MTSPIKPLPEEIDRWITRARWIRWLDAAVGWVSLWAAAVSMIESVTPRDAVVIASILFALAFMVRPLRSFWRPVTACVGLMTSRGLRAGDRAWHVRPDRVDLVLVTARHGTRLVIATPGFDADEGLSVRRTRVLLLPYEKRGVPGTAA